MNLAQRVILIMGCNAIALIWLLPATYQVHADGTRFESNWHWLWHVPHDWSLNVPVTTLRLISIIGCTIGLYLACRNSTPKEPRS
jgi:hypothetical protein